LDGDDIKAGRAILVVEDDPHLRHALSRILRSEGHEVLEASDGPTAILLAKEHGPDLVVLDYMMPGMDGEMVLDALRADLRDAAPPAVLLTVSPFQQKRAIEIGAVLGLEKPFRVPELLDAVAIHRRSAKREAS
jgi:CheY-like chemotaxis protein